MRSLIEPPDVTLDTLADVEIALSPLFDVGCRGMEVDRGLMGGGPDMPFGTGLGPRPLTVRGIRLCAGGMVVHDVVSVGLMGSWADTGT
jgi:hypothetical protein